MKNPKYINVNYQKYQNLKKHQTYQTSQIDHE